MSTIIWFVIFAAIIYWGRKSIPSENNSIIAARKFYGTVDNKEV